MSALFFIFSCVCFLSFAFANYRKIRKFVRKLLGRTNVQLTNLIVKDEGSVEIDLPSRSIDDIQVYFTNESYLPPCDPNDDQDCLSWTAVSLCDCLGCDGVCCEGIIHRLLCDTEGKPKLKVSWKVSRLREIICEIFY